MSGCVRSVFQFGLVCCIGILAFFSIPQAADANIVTYKDTLSDSAPGVSSNHTVQFTTTEDMEPGDYIRLRPDPGSFTIPALNFGINQVELYVNSGGGFSQRVTGTTTSTSTDGVSITTGTSGNVTVTLNSTTGIPADSIIRLIVGNSTANSTSTDVGITNPSATTSYPVFIEKGGSATTSARAWVAIVDQITFGPVDTTEVEPPFRFNGAPSGTLPGTSIAVELSLNTDEFATCRYSSTASTSYLAMTGAFDISGGTIFHVVEIPVSASTVYTYYVRCIDDEGNVNPDDYVITFTVNDPPTGSPGDEGDETEGAENGDGTGTGSSGSGSGSSSGGGGGGGSGGSGGGSGSGEGSNTGSQGGGGFETSDDAYPSGDARVIINGYAFPNRTVVVLVDGTAAQTGRADNNGKFAITLDEIAKGTYSFGVYAIDANNVRSSTFTTTFNVIGGRTSSLSNVNVMPSILVDPDPVDPGQTLTVTGYTIPNATVTIENQAESTSASLKTFTTTSDSSGEWSLEIDTTSFITGTYKIRARAAQTGGIDTNFSDYTYYGVGEEAVTLNADLNRDGSVNLIDFSILLFWWGTDGGDSSPPADINRDGTTSLTDFSILLFQWTG